MKILTKDYTQWITLFEMFLLYQSNVVELCIIVLKKGATVFELFDTLQYQS
jgi:hypothetical protein